MLPRPATRTRADRILNGCVLAIVFGFGFSLAGYWGRDASAIDRYLILAAAVWVGRTRFSTAPSATSPRRPVGGMALVLSGTAALLVAWRLQTGLSGWRVLLLWWQWVAVSGILVGTAVGRSGFAAGRALAFPLVYLAFALPIPAAVDGPLKSGLQEVTTTSSEVLLRGFGLAVTRPGGGFVLHLPDGDLGVEEACSGVRSVTALTALSAFLAHLFGYGPIRGLFLVVFAIPVVVAVNVLRVVLSGLIQESFGGEYIRGGWHEGLGLVMILIGVAGLRGLAGAFRPLPRSARSGQPGGTTRPDTHSAVAPPLAADSFVTRAPARRWSIAAATVLTLGCGGCLAFLASGRAARPAGPAPDLSDVSLKLGGWSGRDLPVPSHVLDVLYPDAVLHREYGNVIGRTATVWVLYWGIPEQIRGYHHPDICLPNAGAESLTRAVVTIQPSAGGQIPTTARVLKGRWDSLYVLYWTQEGRRVWDDDDERAARLGLKTGTRGFVEFLTRSTRGREPVGENRRLVVLIGSAGATQFARAETEGLARLLADEVYRVCPWAGPPGPGSR